MVTTAEENVQVGWRILLNYLTQRQVTRPIFLKMIVEDNDDGLTYDLVHVFKITPRICFDSGSR